MSQTAEAAMPTPKAFPPQLVALVAPDAGMPRVATQGRVRWPLLFAMACSLSFAGAQALRVNAHEETMQQLEMSGQLKEMSDRQIEEQAKGSERKFIVTSIASSLIRPPAVMLGYLVSLFILSWFLRGRSKAGQMAAVAAAALLPAALVDLLSAGAALMHASLPTQGPALIPRTLTQILERIGAPLHGTLATLGNAADLFSLWAALLFSFGLATAAQLPRRKAIPAALIAWTLWRLLFACALHLGG